MLYSWTKWVFSSILFGKKVMILQIILKIATEFTSQNGVKLIDQPVFIWFNDQREALKFIYNLRQ